VETRAGELAALINEAAGEERETLRELALTIVREEVRTLERDSEVAAAPVVAPRQRTNAIAMAIPLFLMGCVTVILFPPVGLLLFFLCGVLVIVGIGTSIFSKAKS
jgi:hypothetical protein